MPFSRAELQREASGQGGPSAPLSREEPDVRVWGRLQDLVCHPRPGRRVCSLRGLHLQMGLLCPACPAPSARRRGGRAEDSSSWRGQRPGGSATQCRTDLSQAQRWFPRRRPVGQSRRTGGLSRSQSAFKGVGGAHREDLKGFMHLSCKQGGAALRAMF